MHRTKRRSVETPRRAGGNTKRLKQPSAPCQLLKVYGSGGTFVGQRFIHPVAGRERHPELLLRGVLVAHPEVEARVPAWLRAHLPKDDGAQPQSARQIEPSELSRLKEWLLANDELKKVKSYSAALRVVSGVCPVVARM